MQKQQINNVKSVPATVSPKDSGTVSTPNIPITGSLDLKESIEMLKAVQYLINTIKEALEDGKIDWKDTLIGLKLLNNFSLFANAAKDCKLIPDELKDLSEAEMIVLVKEIYPMLKDIKQIVLKLKAM